MSDDICPHGVDQRTGIVTNQPDGYDPNRDYVGRAICGDPSCRARAIAWVWHQTGEHGVYVSDSSRKARAPAHIPLTIEATTAEHGTFSREEPLI